MLQLTAQDFATWDELCITPKDRKQILAFMTLVVPTASQCDVLQKQCTSRGLGGAAAALWFKLSFIQAFMGNVPWLNT